MEGKVGEDIPSSAASPLSGQSLATGARLRLMGPDAMVPIRAYNVLVEAELARSLLVGNGLEAELEDQHTAAAYLAQAIGGVKLLVRNADVEVAEEILITQMGAALMQGDGNALPVFRVRSSRAWLGLGVGAGAGLLLATLMGFWQMGFAAGLALLSLTAGGFLVGSRIPRFYCSDRACAHSFGESEQRCPSCGHELVGTIDHMDQRLDAEEAFREHQRDSLG